MAEYVSGPANAGLEVRLVLEAVGPTTGQRLHGKEILLDGVKRPLAEVIGNFNTVVFVARMTQIVEGTPEARPPLLLTWRWRKVPRLLRAS